MSYRPGMVLTPLGAALVSAFNRNYLYARCTRCGLLGSPPRDGHRYSCGLPTCDGIMAAVDPRAL